MAISFVYNDLGVLIVMTLGTDTFRDFSANSLVLVQRLSTQFLSAVKLVIRYTLTDCLHLALTRVTLR